MTRSISSSNGFLPIGPVAGQDQSYFQVAFVEFQILWLASRSVRDGSCSLEPGNSTHGWNGRGMVTTCKSARANPLRPKSRAAVLDGGPAGHPPGRVGVWVAPPGRNSTDHAPGSLRNIPTVALGDLTGFDLVATILLHTQAMGWCAEPSRAHQDLRQFRAA